MMKNNLFKIHLLFIFIFLNIWDYAVNRTFFNGMVLGLIMFGPSSFLWFIGTVRAAALITLVSIFEFTMMMVFSLEGFGLSGASVTTLKSLFWLPYLLMAGINSFLGLRIYSEYREKKHKAIT